MRRALSLLAILLIPAAFAADDPGGKPTPIQPMDVFALQWADNPQLSPDGRQIVYQRNFFDVMKDVRRSNLWLLDVASGATHPLTTGSSNDGHAAWSPDGKRIAFVANDGDKPPIFVRWLDNGS